MGCSEKHVWGTMLSWLLKAPFDLFNNQESTVPHGCFGTPSEHYNNWTKEVTLWLIKWGGPRGVQKNKGEARTKVRPRSQQGVEEAIHKINKD